MFSFCSMCINRYPLPIYGWIKLAMEENEIIIENIEKIKPCHDKALNIKFDISLAQNNTV